MTVKLIKNCRQLACKVVDVFDICHQTNLILLKDVDIHEQDRPNTPALEFIKILSMMTCRLEGIDGIVQACSYVNDDGCIEVEAIDEHGLGGRILLDYESHSNIVLKLNEDILSFYEYAKQMSKGYYSSPIVVK